MNEIRSAQDWNYEPPEYDPSREVHRRPTERTRKYKERNAQPKREDRPVHNIVPSTTEEGARDEPMYDIGPHSSLVPEQDYFCQNFDFAGAIPIINETYEKLRAVDPRLHERLPLSMFNHAMCLHINLEILESARKAGQNVLNMRTDVREILPDYQALPQSIVDYISHITDVVTQDGKEIRINLPNIAIPQPPFEHDGVIIESGTFGPLNAHTHNVYECYLSPYVSSARVIASQNNIADYLPLPQPLIPGNLVPNQNLLGYENIDAQNNGAHSRLDGIRFPSDETLEGRYRYCPVLQNRVYTVLAEMKDRFKIVERKRDNNPQGLNFMPPIKRKVTNTNLTFVEAVGPVNDRNVPLYSRTVNVHSFGAQGSATANQSNVECFHRRRISGGNYAARGLCCLAENGNAPGGWVASLNDNFTMTGNFQPVLHRDYTYIRDSMFVSHEPAGNRINALGNFIERNYYVRKKG